MLPVAFGRYLAITREHLRAPLERDGFVVITQDGGFAVRPDKIDARPRIGAIADHITEAHHGVGTVLLGEPQRGSERFEVGVDIGEDGEAQGRGAS